MSTTNSSKKEDLKIIFHIVLFFLISRLIMAFVYRLTFGNWNLSKCIDSFNIFDAGWYRNFVEGINSGSLFINNDNAQAVWAFFPLYPLIVFFVWKITGGIFNICLIGSVLSSCFFIIAEFYGYKYIMLTRNSKKTAYSYIFLMTFGAYSFYFSIFYTESLFLMLLTLCFYFLKKEKYIAMGICGCLLSATRNAGVMFVFVIAVWCIMQYCKTTSSKKNPIDFFVKHIKNEKLVLGIMMIPAGLFGYMFFLYKYLGDGFAFVHSQKGWGKSFVGIFHILRSELFDVFPPSYLGAATVLILLIMAFSIIRNKNYDEMIYPIIVFLMSATSSIVSIPRYMIGCFTVVLALSDFSSDLKKSEKIILGILTVLFEAILIKEWISGNYILY